MTTTITTATPRDMGSLPDLPLLAIFARLQLTDLFINVPLVCRNWYRLRGEALSRRKHLYIGSAEKFRLRQLDEGILPTEAPPVVINHYCVGSSLDWCMTTLRGGSSIPTTNYDRDVQLNTLPLPCRYTKPMNKSASNRHHHLRAFSSDRAVDCLAHALPHLTELTLVVTSGQEFFPEDTALVHSRLARLLSRYTSSLRLLRLQLFDRRGDEGPPFDSLMNTINTLAGLRSLQLNMFGQVVSTPSRHTGLSPALLARLRSLVLINCSREWLDQLISPNSADGLATTGDLNHSQLAILGLWSESNQGVHQFLAPAAHAGVESSPISRVLAPRVRLLNSGYRTDLPRLVRDFPGLTALSVNYKYSSSSGQQQQPVAQYHQVLTDLWPLSASLTSLSVNTFELSDNLQQRQDLPVLGSVRHLTLWNVRFPNNVYRGGHGGVVSLLHLGHCFPRLERLHLQVLFENTMESELRSSCCQTLPEVLECCQEILRTQLATDCTNLTTVLLNLSSNFKPQVFVRSPGDVQFSQQSPEHK